MKGVKGITRAGAALLAAGMSLVSVQAEETLPSGLPYDDLYHDLDDYVDDLEDDMAALGTAVFTKDEVLFSEVYGHTDRANKVDADEDTVFDWGPVSQLLVWTGAMQLKEEGKLDLEADVRTYLPEGFLDSLAYDAPVTMLHLMNHTAGFEEMFLDTRTNSITLIPPLPEALRKHVPDQVYEPGTVTSQSDWGAALAGYVIECVSGESYADYVHAHILDPLGMKETAVKPDLSDVEGMMGRRRAMKCYTVKMQEILEDYFLYSLYPCGSAVGTFADFVTFTRGLLPGSAESRILFKDPATLTEMLSGSSFYTSGKAKNSHGLWNISKGVELLGISGSTTGCTTSFHFDPESGIAVCVMTNVPQETDFNRGIPVLVFGQGDAFYLTKKNLPKGRFMTANSILTGPFRIASYRAAGLKGDDVTDGYWEVSADGKVFEQPYTDFLKVPASTWLRQDGLIVWFTLAFIMAAGALILWIWPLPGRVYSDRTEKVYRFTSKAGHLLVLIMTVVMMFSFQLGAAFFSSSYFKGAYPVIGVLAALLAAVTGVYVFSALKKKGEVSKVERVLMIARPIMWTGILINVLYWQLYASWLL